MLWDYQVIAGSLSKINRNGWSCNVIIKYADYLVVITTSTCVDNLLGILTKS